MTSLKYSRVDEIQTVCMEAMKLWGYRRLNEEELGNGKINPILPLNEFAFEEFYMKK